MSLTHIAEPTPEHHAARVIVADRDPLARRDVRNVLQAEGFVVAADATNARDMIDLSAFYSPDIVLMDALLAGPGDVSLIRAVIGRGNGVRVVVFSVEADHAMGVRCLQAGASGYLTKDESLQSLPRALLGVLRGEIACSRKLISPLVEHLRASPVGGIGLRPVKSRLTCREWEILDLLCAQETTEAISAHLVLSRETVRTHVKNLLRKLAVGSRQEAVALAPMLRNPGTDLGVRAGDLAAVS